MCGAVPPLLHTSSWHDALLSTGYGVVLSITVQETRRNPSSLYSLTSDFCKSEDGQSVWLTIHLSVLYSQE
jgi:hypothetical protein